jgi:multiple sugar transport system permease protein
VGTDSVLPTLVGLLSGVFGSLLPSASFLNWDLIRAPTWAGLDNFAGLLTDSLFTRSLVNTTSFSVMYVPSVIVLSLGAALLMNRKMRG